MSAVPSVTARPARGIVLALFLLFLMASFSPLVSSFVEQPDEIVSQSVSDSFVSARSSTGWAKMSGGSSNANARYLDVDQGTGDIVFGGQMDGGAVTLSWDGVSVTSGDAVTPWYAKTDSGGNVSWVQIATASGANSPAINPGGLALSNSGEVYVTGSFRGTATFGSLSVTSQGLYDCFIAKMSANGQWQWVRVLQGAGDAQVGTSATLDVVWGTSVVVDSAGDAVIGGFYLGSTDVGNNAGSDISDADIFVVKYSSSGAMSWSTEAKGSGLNEVQAMSIDMNGDAWLASSFETSLTFGAYSVSASGSGHPVIAKIGTGGTWLDAQSGTTTSDTFISGLDLDIAGEPTIAGIFSGSLTMGSNSINSIGEDDGFVASFSAGQWGWLTHVGTTTYDFVSDLAHDPSSGNFIVALSSAGSMNIAGQSFSSQGENDTIIASIDSSGTWVDMVSAHGGADNWAGAVAVDDFGNVAVAGTASGNIDFSSTSAGTASPSGSFGPYLWGISGFGGADTDNDGVFDEDDNCPDDHNSEQLDHDSDGMGDVCDSDDDGDGILDNNGDDCPLGELNWTANSVQNAPDTSSDWDRDGCKDMSLEDLDMDNDQREDGNDSCPRTDWDRSLSVRPLWVSEPGSDQDLDGCRDADEDLDDDNDGVNDVDDNCPDETGTSSKGILIGCPDGDGDGWADTLDNCPDTPGTSENGSMVGCLDSDGDGWADSVDALPLDSTQWVDSDGDGYGDNMLGFRADDCPNQAGGSMEDRYGCKDSDGDGWSDEDFIWSVDDGADAIPDDPTQWTDFDGDGFGDNYGNHSWSSTRPDEWPGEYTLLAMNQDACPLQYGDSTKSEIFGCPDRDGDGWADSIDLFPDDSQEYRDGDHDGFADGKDDCPSTNGASHYDRTGCADLDGDGWSDPDVLWTVGNGADSFRQEPTQWSDADGDGYGDNPLGLEPDACPEIFGTSPLEGELGCPPAQKDDDEDGPLGDESSALAGLEEGDPVTWGLLVAIIAAVLILLMVLLRGGSDDEEFEEFEDGNSTQQYAAGMVPGSATEQQQYSQQQYAQQQYAQPEAVATGPDPSLVGQMRSDGNEWLEYPDASGAWYSRDPLTGGWVRRI